MLVPDDIIESPKRLNALYNLQILDTAPEQGFDRLTLLAKQALKVSMASIVFFDHDRTFIKSGIGLPDDYMAAREMPLLVNLMYALKEAQHPVTRPDTLEPQAGLRQWDSVESMAAAPLCVEDGQLVGAFLVCDGVMRVWTDDEISMINLLAMQVTSELERRDELIQHQRNEAQLQSYTRELEMVNAELDAYGHTIAHDLKDPLNVMLGFVGIMQMSGNLSPDEQMYLERIMSAGYTMTGMIEQLLYLATLRDAKTEMTLVNAEQVLVGVHERLEARLKEAGLTLTIEAPILPILGHAPWLAEIFANLIGNAAHYADTKKPAHYVVVRSLPQGEMVRFEVHDNGVGIAQKDLEKMFKAFSRLEVVKGVRGTGLGLSIVRRIVSRLGGDVGVESVYGEGSTFWFTLPAP